MRKIKINDIVKPFKSSVLWKVVYIKENQICCELNNWQYAPQSETERIAWFCTENIEKIVKGRELE